MKPGDASVSMSKDKTQCSRGLSGSLKGRYLSHIGDVCIITGACTVPREEKKKKALKKNQEIDLKNESRKERQVLTLIWTIGFFANYLQHIALNGKNCFLAPE